MDIRKVKKLIELLEESNIDEIEIKEGEESVRISRNSGQPMALAPAPAYAAPPVAPAPVAAPAPAPAAPAAESAPQTEGHVVKSPMSVPFTPRLRPPRQLLSRLARPSRSATSYPSWKP